LVVRDAIANLTGSFIVWVAREEKSSVFGWHFPMRRWSAGPV